MVRVAVAGAAGRMGIRIIHNLMADAEAEFVGGFEYEGHPDLGRPLAEICGLPGVIGELGCEPMALLAGADVLVEFTEPHATVEHVGICAEMKKACVIGTTGLDQLQKHKIAEAAEKAPVIFAPNMSVGVNLMFRLTRIMTRVLGDGYALEMVEAHHDQKKDAPSGTAVRLLEEMAGARGWDMETVCVHGRQGLVGARPQKEIGVSVIRGGDIVGEHTVYFISGGERLELTHRASSRDTFAKGALRAAQWVADKEPGLYDMQDVLGLKDL